MKINYLATYTTILKEDRDSSIADTSKANNGYYTWYPSPVGRTQLHDLSVHGKQLTVAESFSLVSLLCMAKVDKMLSRLMALEAKQKAQVLHRNKRYVMLHIKLTLYLCLRFSSLAINPLVSSATL